MTRESRWNVSLFALTLAAVGLIKLRYRHGSAAELDWILRPTVVLVEWLSGSRFEKEANIGYVSRTAHFVLVPACAGINFLVICLASLVLAHLCMRRGPMDKLRWLGVAGIVAYGTTLLANAMRITIAMELHARQLSWGWFTEDRVHQTEGALVYLASLLILSMGMTRFARRPGTLAERGRQ